jgi:hypothetical protein
MSYNWCHGPNCHTQQTQSRVRGNKGNKVLRTIKIKQGRYNYYDRGNNNGINVGLLLQSILLNGFYTDYTYTSIVAIAPRREALETNIKDPVKDQIQKVDYPSMDY